MVSVLNGTPVIARSAGTRQSPAQCATRWGLPRRCAPRNDSEIRTEIAMSVADLLSIQLYTLRSFNDLDRVLDTVAAAGFRNVEGIGSHLDDAANVKAKLDARGLRFS